MKKILMLAMCWTGIANAGYDWQVVRVVDGDTVEVEAKWLPKELGNTIKVRIYGVDTPEKGGRAQCTIEADKGTESTKFTQKFLASNKKTVIEIREWDKFGGRVLGDVLVDGKSLRQELIKKGYAREYFGDAKKSWCS